MGTLGFVDELVALLACPLWGMASDRIGVRSVSITVAPHLYSVLNESRHALATPSGRVETISGHGSQQTRAYAVLLLLQAFRA